MMKRQEGLELVKREPVIIYGEDKGFALFPKSEGLWQCEQEINGHLHRKTIHETHITWL